MAMTFKDILNTEASFRYQLLDRMRSDCDYFLGYGQRNTKYLWADDEVEQIAAIKAIYNSFPEDQKPEWLTLEQITEYESKMVNSETIE